MKYPILIARILLGLMFFVFGANAIVHFMHMDPAPGTPLDAITFGTILATSGYMKFVGLLMVISGLLLLVGRFVPMALVILGPIVVNILCFHIFLEHGKGIAPGIVVTVLELFLIAAYRLSFRGLFDAAPEVS